MRRSPSRRGRWRVAVNLKIENVDNTVQAQINSLEQHHIQQHPDAILVDAGSATALNPTLQRAVAASGSS